MKTLIIKSLLTSLYQREVLYPSFPHSSGFAEAKVKRGEGRFFNNDALLMNFLVNEEVKTGHKIKKYRWQENVSGLTHQLQNSLCIYDADVLGKLCQ